MTAERIVLTCSSDEGYAPHAATMLLSALSSTPAARFTVYYLHDPGFSEQTRQTLRGALQHFGARLELHFIAVPDSLVAGLPLFRSMAPGAVPPVMWYRVFLPELLPQEERVLYLDCDTLVVDDLRPLWRTALGGQAIAAVTNPFWQGAIEQGWAARCGLQRHDQYFNSGVMLLNLQVWRQQGLSNQVAAHGRANADWTRFGDQDSLVALLHDRRVPLAPRWNVMRILLVSNHSRQLFSDQDWHEAWRHPAIIHFEGSTKPWIDPSKHPYGRLHARYARRLPWPVPERPWGAQDFDNFLTRRHWLRLRSLFRRLHGPFRG